MAARETAYIPVVHPEKLYTERDAAGFLDCEPRTLQAWRQRGVHLRFLKIGRLVKYRGADLLSFLEAAIVEPAEG